MKQFIKKAAVVLPAVTAASVVFVEPALADTVLTQGMVAALEEGFTNLQDTVADVIGTVWPYMLAVLALYAAPTIVRKLWNLAAR
jgi:hypothetical protein